MRTFIAIEVPEAVRQALTREQAQFRAACPDARWTRPEGFHLTLKFLGEVGEDHIASVVEKLRGLGAFENFSVEVSGLGFFPNARRPRVFWAGIEAPPALAHLAARVEDQMAALRLEREQRDFSPHLTLARFKVEGARGSAPLQKLVAERARETFGSFEVSEFFLWESKLSPAGASYRKVVRFPQG